MQPTQIRLDKGAVFESLWRQEASFSVADIEVLVGHYDWPDCVETELLPDRHHISLSLSPRPYHTQGCLGGETGSRFFRDAGDLIFFPANVPFYGRSSGGVQRLLMCNFGTNRIRRFKSGGDHWDNQQLNNALDLRDEGLRSTLLRIAEETLNPGFAGDVLLETLMDTLTIDLLRYLHRAEDTVDSARGGLASWQMRRIRERVESEIEMPPSVVELANLCSISTRHVMRGFKQSTGSTLHAYVEQVRLTRAKRLLLDTDQCIKTIAGQLGFAQTSSFSAAFRRVLGISPSTFRARQRC
jgi:AraC family transcriptional regulator